MYRKKGAVFVFWQVLRALSLSVYSERDTWKNGTKSYCEGAQGSRHRGTCLLERPAKNIPV